MRLLLLLCLGLFLLPVAASAQERVDLELVLLADATGSIDEDEIRFQRQGYADAIRHPDVLAAIRNTGYGRIALSYVEWADQFSQDVVVDWMVVSDLASAEVFASRLMAAPRRAYGRNAIGSALLAGHKMLLENEFSGNRLVIDFSADSANNWSGPPIETARDQIVADGVVINGLAVLCRDCWSGRPVSYDLEQAFRDRIVGGPGSFVVTADGPKSFATAVRRKMVLEIAGEIPIRSAATTPPRPARR